MTFETYANNREWAIVRGAVPVGLEESESVEILRSSFIQAIRSRDEGRWHLSVSHVKGIYPSWDQLADARYDLLPHDIDVALILPPPKDYVNAHPGVLQMHEVRDPGLVVDRDERMVRTKLTEGGKAGAE